MRNHGPLCSPRPERGGRPNASAVAFLPGRSSVVPSIAVSRQSRQEALLVSGEATGRHTTA